MRQLSIFLILVVFLFVPRLFLPSVHAQAPEEEEEDPFDESLDLEMELLQEQDVVVTATKRAQKIEHAPSIVEVITFEDIRRRGYRTVGEALRGVPGIGIINDHVDWNVGIRGIYAGAEAASDILKVMINGQSVSFRSMSANFFGPELLPIEAVKRIEIVRGPASALYGANAFLGVINVITFDGSEEFAQGEKGKNGGSGRHGLVLSGDYLHNQQHQNLNGGGSIFSGRKSGDFRYFIGGTFHYTDRSGMRVPGESDMLVARFYREDPVNNPAPDRFPSPGWDAASREWLLRHSPSRNDLRRSASLYTISSYDLKESGRLFLDANMQYKDNFGEFLDFSHLTHKNRLTYLNGFARIRYQLEPEGDEGISLNLTLALAGGEPTDDDHIVNPLTLNHYMRRLFGYRAWDLVAEASYAFSRDNVISLGFDYTNDWEDLLSKREVDELTGDSTSIGYGERTFVNLGIYAQWVYSPVERLGLTIGTRLDHNNVIACDSRQWDCIISLEDQELSPDDLKYFLEGTERSIPIENRGFFQISNRAGAVYELPFLGMYTKATYGSSFKPPSAYQLYHPNLTHFSSVGTPFLKPQTADTFEFLLGSKPVDGLHVVLDFFYTSVTDKVLSFMHPWGVRPESRNADVTVYGLEGKVTYKLDDWLTAYFNVTSLLENQISPKKKWDENDIEYELSVFNDTLSGSMFPSLLLAFGVNAHLPEVHLNANLDVNLVGERRASMVNNQLYKRTSLRDTYTLDSYVLVDLTVSSVGIHLFGAKETVFSLSFRYRPLEVIEPGYGGIDIPGLRSRLLFRITQHF